MSHFGVIGKNVIVHGKPYIVLDLNNPFYGTPNGCARLWPLDSDNKVARVVRISRAELLSSYRTDLEAELDAITTESLLKQDEANRESSGGGW